MDTKLDGIILHYALTNKKFMLELSKSIKPEYFNERFQLFYSILLRHFNDPSIREVISQEALKDYCLQNSLNRKADIFQTIYQKALDLKLDDGKPPAASDFGYYLKKIKERYNVLVVKTTAEKINEAIDKGLACDELNQIVSGTIHDISSINQIEVFDQGTIAEDALNMWKEYEAIEASPDRYKGILVGYKELDNITNGFQGSELVIIAGMEGSGKSALMMNMAINAWLGSNHPEKPGYSPTGANVLYFSLEMPRSNRGEFTSGAYLNKRVLSCVSELPFELIRKGELTSDDKDKLKTTCDFLAGYKEHNFYVVDIPRGARVEDIEVKFLEIQEEAKIDLVVVDYIGIMAGAEKDENDWQSQGNVAAGLHEFARTYNVPVVSAVQLNRPQNKHSLTKANENLNNNRVARSAMITQNANVVLAIGCRDNEEMYPDMPIFITKMRDGRRGSLSFTKALDRMKIYDGTPINMSDNLDEFEDFESLDFSEEFDD